METSSLRAFVPARLETHRGRGRRRRCRERAGGRVGIESQTRDYSPHLVVPVSYLVEGAGGIETELGESQFERVSPPGDVQGRQGNSTAGISCRDAAHLVCKVDLAARGLVEEGLCGVAVSVLAEALHLGAVDDFQVWGTLRRRGGSCPLCPLVRSEDVVVRGEASLLRVRLAADVDGQLAVRVCAYEDASVNCLQIRTVV